jgi:hypothetical protein
MTTDLEAAAAVISIGRTRAHELVKAGDFPVQLLAWDAAWSCRSRTSSGSSASNRSNRRRKLRT